MWTQYCTGTTQTQGQTMALGVANTHGGATSEMIRANNGNFPTGTKPANGVAFYLFATPQDYADSASSLGLGTAETVGQTDFGVTHFNSQNVPVYSAVFLVNKTGESANISRATGQQVGRALDYLEGYIKNGGIVPPQNLRMSDTGTQTWASIYLSELNADYRSASLSIAPCGSGGLFTGFADSTYPGPNYICDGTNGTGNALSSGYSGLNNQAVLHKAWPTIYPAAGAPPAGGLTGMFAEQYDVLYIGNDKMTRGRTADIYQANFTCSNFFVKWVGDHANLPNNTEVPTGCVVPTNTTTCQKIFNGDGHFPDGNVSNCILAGQYSTYAETLFSSLLELGRRGQPSSYTAIKAELTTSQSNVYVFPDSTTYTNAFNAAGVAATQWLSGEAGTTYHWVNLIYTIDLQAPQGFAPFTPSQFVEVGVHESGHAVDIGLGFASQSANSKFDTAMINDLITLDFTAVGSTQANSTPRKPCNTSGYTGPLLGIIDPTTGNPFCNGSGGFTTGDTFAGNNPATGKPWLMHEILRDSRINGNYFFSKQPASQIGDQQYPGGWSEWYAQAFRDVAYADVGGSGAYPVSDGVVLNKYLVCTAGTTQTNGVTLDGWLSQVYQGQFTPVLPANTCNQNIPAWFHTLIGD